MARDYIHDERTLSAFLTYATPRERMAAAKISKQVYYQLIHDDNFQIALHERETALYAAALGRLQGALTAAVDTLTAINSDEENAPQVRINAARALLSQAVQLDEHVSLLARVDALERLAQNKTGQNVMQKREAARNIEEAIDGLRGGHDD